jgi:error-prone DNA polymerase
MDGPEVVCRWREAGEWWLGEPYREHLRVLDPEGIPRETAHALPERIVLESTRQTTIPNKVHDDYSLRERKIRNEKFAAASGKLNDKYYEQAAAERREAANTAWDVSLNVTPQARQRPSGYAALHVLSGYAMGRSVMLTEEIATCASLGGCSAVVLADPYALTGAVEHEKACKRYGLKPIIGASIELPEGGFLTLIAQTALGYRNLSQLITACHLEEPRCYPLGSWKRLETFSEDLICLTGGDFGPLDRRLVKRDFPAADELVKKLIAIFGREKLFVEIDRAYLPWSIAVEKRLLELAQEHRLTPVAGGAVTHAKRDHFPAQDMVACIDTLCLIEEVIGRKPLREETQPQIVHPPTRALNAERFFHSDAEMRDLYQDRFDLLENTKRVADLCEESILPGRVDLPKLFEDDNQALLEIVEMNSHACYRDLTKGHRNRLKTELDRITGLGYASHFLAAWDVCRWAREQDIQMSGRGSVVDSAVAYVLGLSRIDAIEHKLHFDRFLPADNTKRPDIDIDFEAHRRDDVRGYMIGKYGVNRTAAVCAIGTYCTRGIVREVGKVMGLPEASISFLAKKIHGGISPDQIEAALRERPELRDSSIPKEKFVWVIRLAERLMDVPRNMRTHSSGVVISNRPISEIVPTVWSATTSSRESQSSETMLRMMQWDKRSAKKCFDKFDILCLRGQDVLGGVERRIKSGQTDFSVEQIDATVDPEVYRAMRSGELIGIPQSASPAMRQAHIRLRTENLHDASLVQAGIRPGVGGAVKLNELIARRRGKPFRYEHPDFKEILGSTYGIIVFQEQVDQLLQKFCTYSGGEAEDIRDTIHKRRREDLQTVLREKLFERVLKNGYSIVVAEQVLELVCGFKGYGFAQGHALAFAEVSLRSVWCMQNYPADYFAALLSAQPAGYYGPCTIANEARARGVRILHPDVNLSGIDFQVEDAQSDLGLVVPHGAIRVGLMQIDSLSAKVRERIVQHRIEAPSRTLAALQPLPTPRSGGHPVALAEKDESSDHPENCRLKPFLTYFDFVAKVKPKRDELECLILSGALDSLCPNRRAMLWAIPDAYQFADSVDHQDQSGVLPFEIPEPTLNLAIEEFSYQEKIVFERKYLGLDIDTHLMGYERERVKKRGGLTAREIQKLPKETKALAVGNPIRLRFPPTSSGKRVVFFDLEDESGLLNVTAFDDVYRRDGRALICSTYVTVVGEVQDRDGHAAFLAHRIFEYKPLLFQDHRHEPPIKTADFLVG